MRYSPKLQQLHTQISALKELELSRPITVVSSQEDKDEPPMSQAFSLSSSQYEPNVNDETSKPFYLLKSIPERPAACEESNPLENFAKDIYLSESTEPKHDYDISLLTDGIVDTDETIITFRSSWHNAVVKSPNTLSSNTLAPAMDKQEVKILSLQSQQKGLVTLISNN